MASTDVSMQQLLEAGAHFGHQTHRWNPKMKPYIFGERHGLRQVEDVDAVAGAEDVRLHARVPAVGLVAEMRAGFDQLLHGDDRCRHRDFLSGCASGRREPCGPDPKRVAGAPVCVSSMWIACGTAPRASGPLGELAYEIQPQNMRRTEFSG